MESGQRVVPRRLPPEFIYTPIDKTSRLDDALFKSDVIDEALKNHRISFEKDVAAEGIARKGLALRAVPELHVMGSKPIRDEDTQVLTQGEPLPCVGELFKRGTLTGCVNRMKAM
jgi:hypothetical protein